jgi:16S rRNA processing protein RimM
LQSEPISAAKTSPKSDEPQSLTPDANARTGDLTQESKSIKNGRNPRKTGASIELVPLAKIGRPYGLTGAMRVFPYSNDAATLRKAKRIFVDGKDYPVQSIRVHGDALVMTIDGVNTPELAQTFTNAEIAVTREAFAPLPDGEYYWVDLIGLDCVNGERRFGAITEIFEAGAHPILRVEIAGKPDELIPFVDAIVRSVDLAARRVDVNWDGVDGSTS